MDRSWIWIWTRLTAVSYIADSKTQHDAVDLTCYSWRSTLEARKPGLRRGGGGGACPRCPPHEPPRGRASCTNEGQDDHLFIPAIDSKQMDARLPTISADLLLHTSPSSTSVAIHWNGPVAALATVGNKE